MTLVQNMPCRLGLRKSFVVLYFNMTQPWFENRLTLLYKVYMYSKKLNLCSTVQYSPVGWSDIALFAIFRYIFKNLIPNKQWLRNDSFSKNRRDLKN